MRPEKTESRTERKSPKGSLAVHRRRIRSLDARILDLVSRRMRVAESIGQIKREEGIPLRNYEVEAEVHARLESLAGSRGEPAALASDLAGFLIRWSLEAQAPMVERAYGGNRLRTVVVGGAGGMGGWMARFLNGQGHAVDIVDPSTVASPFARVTPDGREVLEADLVVVAVPMSVCPGILAELSRVGCGGVVLELCSFKGPMLPLFERLRGAGLRLVSAHPMFGPGATVLSGKTVVVCGEGREEDRAFARGLFASTSAKVVEMGTLEHDRRMAMVLGLTHLSNLVLSRALQVSGHPFGELREVAGVTFSRQMDTSREVAAENPELYFEIQAMSQESGDAAGLLARALGDLRGLLEADDRAGFVSMMVQLDAYYRG